MFEQQIKSGIHHFIAGCQLITQKGLRRFVIMPIILNVLLMISLFWLFITQAKNMIGWIISFLPTWLDWLSSIMLILSVGMILILFYFSFTMLSGFIAAPFNGLLAEKVEKMLTGESLAEMSMADFARDIPRMLKREWQKLLYSLPIYMVLFLLGFVPLIGQTIIPIIAFIFAAWMMAIQYCDYPFDNHKIAFPIMRSNLKQQKYQSLTFGCLVSICTIVPILNLIIIPIAVCGATSMWVENYRSQLGNNKTMQESTALATSSGKNQIIN